MSPATRCDAGSCDPIDIGLKEAGIIVREVVRRRRRKIQGADEERSHLTPCEQVMWAEPALRTSAAHASVVQFHDVLFVN